MSNQSSLSITTIILFVVGLLIGAGGGYFLTSSTYQSDIETYASQVSELKSTINTLEVANINFESQVSDLSSKIGTLVEEKTTLQSSISELEDDLDEAEETISSQAARITRLEAEIEAGKPQPSQSGFKIASLGGVYVEYPEEDRLSLQYTEYSAVDYLASITALGGSWDRPIGFMLMWPSVFDVDLNQLLDNAFYFLNDPEKGPKVNTTLNGHEIIYQNYTATLGYETPDYGVIAVWYCDTTDESFTLTYNSDDEGYLPLFFQILGSITCH